MVLPMCVHHKFKKIPLLPKWVLALPKLTVHPLWEKVQMICRTLSISTSCKDAELIEALKAYIKHQREDQYYLVEHFFDGYERLSRKQLGTLAVAHGLSVSKNNMSEEDYALLIVIQYHMPTNGVSFEQNTSTSHLRRILKQYVKSLKKAKNVAKTVKNVDVCEKIHREWPTIPSSTLKQHVVEMFRSETSSEKLRSDTYLDLSVLRRSDELQGELSVEDEFCSSTVLKGLMLDPSELTLGKFPMS
ncbi:uncharacterized protein EDB91DRAFT_1077829 [Suillus paluster]|uniref:uncharacterized protein n=1 Tax=Suillus paluster TaxID=48578 RepID=UPI001B87AEA4|nr:uncharacterized protein EDB91DRAFT_1077829 [Suillus paluster]KAG1752434.1 hypothetical protein EDB91DRAFT_1077829 [Suillus paluster]